MITVAQACSLRPAPALSCCSNLAPHAMQAHRLWIKLWISLGHPAENQRQPGGNAAVTRRVRFAAHSPASARTQARHSPCAWARPSSPARTAVIPRIHCAYDDYQTSYVSLINPQVALGDPDHQKEEGDR